ARADGRGRREVPAGTVHHQHALQARTGRFEVESDAVQDRSTSGPAAVTAREQRRKFDGEPLDAAFAHRDRANTLLRTVPVAALRGTDGWRGSRRRLEPAIKPQDDITRRDNT